MSHDPVEEFNAVIQQWNHRVTDPIPVLTRIAEIIERETATYLKMPIDPYDVRHPSRTNPECSLGQVLKKLFRAEDFMNALSADYIMASNNFPLNCVSCRVLLDILPGLESSVVFNGSENFVPTLIQWAEKADHPLNAYATGLLAAAMEINNIAEEFSEQNHNLVHIMLTRLRQLNPYPFECPADDGVDQLDPRDFADADQRHSRKINCNTNNHNNSLNSSNSNKRQLSPTRSESPDAIGHKRLNINGTSSFSVQRSPVHNECSNSSWAEMHMSGSYQMDPLSIVMQQRFILQYLTSVAGYHNPQSHKTSSPRLLTLIFEHKALSHILHFIDSRKNKDVRLAFDALKFLSQLLPYKKFALQFLDHAGLQQILKVNRQGMASSGVAVCLNSLARNRDVMERICLMPRSTTELMVDYGQWLLLCSYESSRCSASEFFAICFEFPLLLRLFDEKDGLRKLMNVMRTKGIFDDTPPEDLTEDEIFSRRHTARKVCPALLNYARAHFILEARKQATNVQNDSGHKPIELSDAVAMEEVERLRQTLESTQENSNNTSKTNRAAPLRFNWVERLLFVEKCFTDLLKLVARSLYEGRFSGRLDVIRNVLEVILLASFSPRLQNFLLNEVIRMSDPFPKANNALTIIMTCADPKLIDPNEFEAQKSALNLIINLVCYTPTFHPSAHNRNVSTPNATSTNISMTSNADSTPVGPQARLSQSLSRRRKLAAPLRNAVWSNNGTMVLPKLLTITSPVSEADAIRALACRALTGLAREDNIRAAMRKLPAFEDDQIRLSILKPVLPDRRKGEFSKLYEMVTGLPSSSFQGTEASIDEIRRRDVVSRTKITYNKDEAISMAIGFLRSELPQNELLRLVSEPRPNQQEQHHQLDHIFTEYLRSEHALCKNPVSTCPPFSLLAPHRCPKPSNRGYAHPNIAARLMRRCYYPPAGGLYGRKYDRNLIYSKYRPYKTVRDPLEYQTSCCAFSLTDHFLFIGTQTGEMNAYNLNSHLVEAKYECHQAPLSVIQPSADGTLILTTAPNSAKPECTLWTFTDTFARRIRFPDQDHAEFGKRPFTSYIISTSNTNAKLWDVNTERVVRYFEGNDRYTLNRATLSWDDTLVLNDGILWDIRDNCMVHKFDQYNHKISGIFHRNGNEIIANTKIYDLRRFRHIRDVPEFDQCNLKFNSTGDVIFSTIFEEFYDDTTQSEFKTSFRTFDSYDYSVISTIDLRRTLVDLAIDPRDEYIALVGATAVTRSGESYPGDNICRIYEIGKSKYEGNFDLGDDEDSLVDDEEDDDEGDSLVDFDEEEDGDDQLIAFDEEDDDDDDDDDDDADGDSDAEVDGEAEVEFDFMVNSDGEPISGGEDLSDNYVTDSE